MVAGIGNADLDVIGCATGKDGGYDFEHMTDAVVFNRQSIAGIVLKITGGKIGTHHAERVQWVMIEQGVVDAIDHDDRRIDVLINPFRKLIRTKHQVKTHRRGSGVGNREIE